jgi:hypothetical protein
LRDVRSGLPDRCDAQLFHLLGKQVTKNLILCLEQLTRLDAAIYDDLLNAKCARTAYLSSSP